MTSRRSRRAFLLGAAGTGLALPFLPSFRGASGGGVLSQLVGTGRAQADATAPKRVVFWLGSWGTIPNLWDPLNTSADGTRWDLNSIMEPLAPFKDRMTVLSGINMASLYHQAGRTGSHSQGHANVFSSAGHHSEYPYAPDSEWLMPSGPSIDQVIASRIGGSTRFPSLLLGDGSEHLDGFVRREDGSTPGILYWPHELFDRAFADFAGDSTERARVLMARRSMLDAVLPGYEHLRGRVNPTDARILDAHLTSLRDLERRFGSVNACTAPMEPVRTGWADEQTTYPDPQGPYAPLLDLAARTLLCDQTRVMTIRFAGARAQVPSIVPGFAGMNPEHPNGDAHSYSHGHWREPGNQRVWAEIQRWRLRLFVDFLRTLDSVTDIDGRTVLDNTVVVHISEIMTGLHDTLPRQEWGYSNPMDPSSPYRPTGLPVFYVGGCGGKLRTGLHLDLTAGDTYAEGLGKYSHGELWLTIARAMGVTPEQLPTFGTPAVCQRVISEMLV